jgi:hypothetical protein
MASCWLFQLTTHYLRLTFIFERRSKCPEETERDRPREAGAEPEEDGDRDAARAEAERAARGRGSDRGENASARSAGRLPPIRPEFLASR